MHAGVAWVGAALVAAVIFGCPAAHPASGDAGLDARTSVDAGIDARVRSDAGRDAARPSTDAGTDALLVDASAIDAYDAGPSVDANGDAARFCPVGGGCTQSTGEPGRCCGGACVDDATDPTNCGGCGVICGPDRRCRDGGCEHASCVGVISGRACPLSDGTFGTCCDGTCRSYADYRTDDANCGACGRLCPPGVVCAGSLCGPVGPACDYRTSAPCPPGTICPYGGSCQRATCVGATDGVVCALPLGEEGVCCAGVCVDANSDDANCGACGNVCGPSTRCGGSCITPQPCTDPGRYAFGCALASGGIGRCCGTSCVDTAHDALNCLSCGVACPVGSICDGGYRCVTSLADGGRVQVHCASDGDCPSGFHCLPGVPGYYCGRDDCTGVPDGASCGAPGVAVGICCGGACVDSWRDPNCGGCGRSCPSGVCVTLTYAGGGPVLTCLPIASDPTDCGGAGGCPSGETCVGGVCVTETCADDGALCVTGSGTVGRCCSTTCGDIANDPTRCGDCFTRCDTGETCERGRCVAP